METKKDEDTTLGWIASSLGAVIIIELIAIAFMVGTKRKKFNVYVLPVFFFFMPAMTATIVIIILSVIAILLFLYILSLMLKKRSSTPVVHKEIIREIHVSHVTVNKETKTQMTKNPIEEDELTDTELSETETKDGIYIRYNYSFEARMHQAPIESQQRFSDIKNHVLSYKHVYVKKSWRYERFMYQGKPIMKVWINGNNMSVFFNLDPKKYLNESYDMQDQSDKKMHENTPLLLKVNHEKSLALAKQLIDNYMKGVSAEKINIKQADYSMPYRTKEYLIKKGLIKVKETMIQLDKSVS